MSEKVWPLLRFKADNDDELKEMYKKVYIDEYVNQEIYDFNGKRVIFPYSQFEHAFSESSNYKTSNGYHDIPFSKKRARYLLWIKKVIMKDTGNIDYKLEYRSEMKTKKGKKVTVRIYAVIDERYIVVLDQKENKLYFVTGIPHDKNSYKRMVERSALLKQEKVPSSLGD
ncbi:hypothetical protein [Sulfurimonas autotrophica]|uniref:Phage-Barnase-EndoU-ColicinE5/D-RelE like nuclease 2 domain-containing protein n=1 Tax=Sulfurimonas autotrophica (strain ATCC BAA-671 / DSM 16294 / JCM 11897 / OK10) TaxID=563040 RepID=E0UTB6_SULAO|nr:hypothetical protein [Sulfurimonas autotrophica]ADN08219.1 hypothetical protein Saut_0170 [Sulfurimonas autotrophica DSM 16294]